MKKTQNECQVSQEILDAIKEALDNNQPELLRSIKIEDLRNGLKVLLASGMFELHPATISLLVLEEAWDSWYIPIWSNEKKKYCNLAILSSCDDDGLPAMKSWVLSRWTDLAKKCRHEYSVQGGERVERDPPKIDFLKFEFKDILNAANMLWTRYLTDDRDCMARWIYSIDKAIEIITACKSKKGVGGHKFTPGGYFWPCYRTARDSLLGRLEKEKECLFSSMDIEALEALKTDFTNSTESSLGTISREVPRDCIMLAIFAKLIAETAECSVLWNNGDKRLLFSLFVHILTATDHKVEFPFHFHLDLYRDSYRRLGRKNGRSGNVADAIVDGKFNNEAERQIMLMFLAYYLQQNRRDATVMSAIKENDAFKAYFGKERVASWATDFKLNEKKKSNKGNQVKGNASFNTVEEQKSIPEMVFYFREALQQQEKECHYPFGRSPLILKRRLRRNKKTGKRS